MEQVPAAWYPVSTSVERVAAGARVNLEYDREFFEKDEKEWRVFAWYENRCGYTKLKDADPDSKPELQGDGIVRQLERT